MDKLETLGEAVRHYGYAEDKSIRLYGKQLRIVSDPINPQGDEVFVAAREEGTTDVRQVQIPRNIVQMARNRELEQRRELTVLKDQVA